MGLSIEWTPTHSDDLIFLIDHDEMQKIFQGLITDFSEEEKSTSKHMIKYWTNFAKYGTPTGTGDDSHEPAWYPVRPGQKVSLNHYQNLFLHIILELHGSKF